MYGFVKWLYLLALIVWVGQVVFFSFVVAPVVFRTFAVPEAGRAVGAIFPTYYRLGYACGTVLLASSVVFLMSSPARSWWGANAVLSAAMLAATLYAGVVVHPRATVLRPQVHEAATAQSVKDEFSRLHRVAVMLNGAVLLCGVAVSVITAVKLKP
jgi:uncharacterized membrane protein